MTEFENKKNMQAGTLTGLTVGLLMMLCFIVSWTMPTPPPPMLEEGMEVNLGNSEDGSGEIQPLIPGEPSLAQETVNTPPPSRTDMPEETRDVETNDEDKEAPDVSIPKSNNPKPEAKKIPVKEETPKSKTTTTTAKPVNNPTPAPPKPKYVYSGGTSAGNGGNNADSWNNSKSEGNTTGSGDRGKINGDPNSKNYDGSGGSGNGGMTITGDLRGRKIIRQPSFTDDFNENGKIAMDLVVNTAGVVTNATYQPRGSTTSNSTLRSIAQRKAMELKFATGNEQRGTVIFIFRVKD
jgi:hypothetical protein